MPAPSFSLDPPCRQKDPRNRLSVTVDGAALLAQLPLPAGQSCSIPLTIAAAVRATHAAEEVFSAEICLECVSQNAAEPLMQSGSDDNNGADDASSGASTRTVLGRHAVLPLQVYVQPSLQMCQVSFRDIYLPAEQAAAAAAATAAVPSGASSSSSSSTFERRCVMEVSVSNRGRWPLQV